MNLKERLIQQNIPFSIVLRFKYSELRRIYKTRQYGQDSLSFKWDELCSENKGNN